MRRRIVTERERAALGGLRYAAPMANGPARAVPHAATTKKVLAELARMSPEELKATFVKAGIYTADGKLTAAYGGRARKPAKRKSAKRSSVKRAA
jgi:hypothetical protein